MKCQLPGRFQFATSLRVLRVGALPAVPLFEIGGARGRVIETHQPVGGDIQYLFLRRRWGVIEVSHGGSPGSVRRNLGFAGYGPVATEAVGTQAPGRCTCAPLDRSLPAAAQSPMNPAPPRATSERRCGNAPAIRPAH